jgi:hypothetical protein
LSRDRILYPSGFARCDLGFREGLEDLWEAYGEVVRLGLGDEVDLVCSWLSEELWLIEGPESALRTCKEGIERSERHGATTRAMQGRAESLSMLYDLGEWDKLLDVGKQSV